MNVTSVCYAFLAGLIPSLIWLFFWLREDTNPEPRPLLLAAFAGGMLAVVGEVFVERSISDVVSDSTTRYILWAAFEEIIKFVAVALVALHTSAYDEPIDAMIYCITVALGFAALENALFILGPLSGGEIARSILTGNMRFIGATLVHIVSSASVGALLGYTFYKGHLAKFTAAIVGLGCAITIHAAFNISIINTANAYDTLHAFAWIWGAVVLLIVMFEEVKSVHPRFFT